MAKRQRRVRRTPRPVIEEAVEGMLATAMAEAAAEELAAQEPAEEVPTRRVSRRTRRAPSNGPEPEPEDEEFAQELDAVISAGDDVAAPVKAITRKVTRKPVAAEKPSTPGPEEVDTTVKSAIPASLNLALEGQKLLDLLEAMEQGQSLVIAKISPDQWRLAVSKEEVVVSGKPGALKGREYYLEVHSPAYVEHEEAWTAMSVDEKYAVIEESGVEWAEHEDERIDLMRATMAYRDKLASAAGLTFNEWKFNPGYRTRAARAAVRSSAK